MKQQISVFWSLILWLAFFGWMSTVFSLTSAPPSTFQNPNYFLQIPDFLKHLPHFDKLIHFCFYFGCLFFLTLAVKTSHHWLIREREKTPFIILSLLALGAYDELHQLFVPGRSADLLDYAADLTGGFAAIWFVSWLAKKASQRKRKG